MRVVVVGAGPKGLQAASELVHRALETAAHPGSTAVTELVLVDPQPPGVGAAYLPSQPEWLRLNVSPDIVHLPPLPPLPQWRPLADDVPRALVGRYLAEAFDRLVELAPFPVRHLPQAATSLVRAPDAWRLGLADGSTLDADQVLLATGHALDWDGALRHDWRCDLPLVDAVYPVEKLDAIQPGARVAVRGAALTFIDLALTLTEGRPREEWPGALYPLGRSGALLSAKPAAIGDPRPDELPSDPDALLATVERLAVELLARVTGDDPDPQGVASTLRTGWEPDLDGRPGRAVTALRRSIALVDGKGKPGPAWALGRVWAARYRDVVAALSFHEPEAGQWKRFLTQAAVLERFTFGPPIGNARRLLTLCTEGPVDVSWLEAGVRVDADGLHDLPTGATAPDWVVDAVLPPPGAESARNPLLDALLADGTLQLAAHRRGIDVGPDAATAAPGLSVLGRPVEDIVVGNDTLSRTLHDLPRRWAERVLP